MTEYLRNFAEKCARILFVWNSGEVQAPEYAKTMAAIVTKLISDVGGDAKNVAVENLERLEISTHSSSSFDAGVLFTSEVPTYECFAEIMKYLKSSRSLRTIFIAQEKSTEAAQKLQSQLKLAGFIEVSLLPESGNAFVIDSKRPNYELGKSESLSFALKSQEKSNPKPANKVWQLSAADIVEDDLITEEELLTEEDYKKPTPTAARGCDESAPPQKGKRRACKNCTCGLAEMEDDGGPSAPKSACGNCFLGDAFRCSSCPYAGLPPFRPGEEVKLTPEQMRIDMGY